MNLFMYKLNKRKFLSILVLLMIFMAFGHWQPLNEVNAEATKTLKACHICDPVLPDASITPIPTLTPDACALDCIDSDLTPSRVESTPVFGQIQPEDDALSIIFYWMEGCPRCDDVIKNTLPLVEQEFGPAINIQKIEIKTLDEVNQLFVIGERYGLQKEEILVPLILVGEQVITGDEDVSERLPALIQLALSPQTKLEPPAAPDSAAAPRLIRFVIGGGLVVIIILGLFLFRKRTLK